MAPTVVLSNETRIPIITRLQQKVKQEMVKLAAEQIAADDKLYNDQEFITTGLYPIAEQAVDGLLEDPKYQDLWKKCVEDTVRKNKDSKFNLPNMSKIHQTA